MAWNDLTPKQQKEARKKISRTMKTKGIKPPSNKGKKFSKEHVEKIIESKRKNGSLYHTLERTSKIVASRKKHYDKVGRKSPFVDRIKSLKQYKDWRTAVFERDNYTCVLCNHSGYVEADHIEKKSDMFKLCNYDIEKCLEYKPLWDIDNGRTLCKPCHKETPNYGAKVNGAKSAILKL